MTKLKLGFDRHQVAQSCLKPDSDLVKAIRLLDLGGLATF
jgi:hypothetical protein